ncbi:N-acetyltransferase, partial [Streptococcus suis]
TCEEVDYLTGTTQTFSRDDIIRYHNRVVSSSERFDFILVAPDGRFIGEAVVNEVDTLDQSANFRIVIFDK